MKEILLVSDILKVTKVMRKTTAKLFGELREGDKIQLVIPVKRSGVSHVGSGKMTTKASYITIENISTGDKVEKKFNELSNILGAFEFEGGGKYMFNKEDTVECDHKNKAGKFEIEYQDIYEMRGRNMYCKLCGTEGSREELKGK